MDVCVDACVIVKVVTNEPDSNLANALVLRWATEDYRVLIPQFAYAEIDSQLRKKVTRNIITQQKADEAYTFVSRIPLIAHGDQRHRQRAWEIATQLNEPTVYDAVYLAIAELRDCEFWTADERLFNKVHGQQRFGYVHILSEAR